MPRALQVISTGGLYGAERVLLELSRFLNDHGWDSRVLAIDGRGAVPLVAAAERMGMRAELFSAESTGVVAPARRLARYLDEHAIDLVHSHGYKPDILLAMTRQPAKRACLATCHSWYSNTLKLRLYEWLDKRVLRSFRQIVAVSGEIEHSLLAAGLERNRVRVISNGLDLALPGPNARAAIRAALRVPDDGLLLLRIGRLVAPKGNAVLLRALATLERSDWRLAFVGDGDQQAELQALAQTLGIGDSVMFCGFRDNIADYLAAADVFVSPSLQEGLPMVLLEAMAAGLAVVSTNVGEIPQVITSERDGLLVPPGDVDELCGALERMMRNPAERDRWRSMARDKHAERYSRASMGQAYLPLYDAALRRQ